MTILKKREILGCRAWGECADPKQCPIYLSGKAALEPYMKFGDEGVIDDTKGTSGEPPGIIAYTMFYMKEDGSGGDIIIKKFSKSPFCTCKSGFSRDTAAAREALDMFDWAVFGGMDRIRG